MNNDTPKAGEATELQFDQAEYVEPAAGVPTCVACHQTIPDQYYQVNGAVLCEPCSSAVEAHLTGGSSLARFAKASLFGFGAAIAGFAIYFGVLKLTGYEVGLISILVGYMVGAAVHKGSSGRGGAIYQMTAIFFTYLAIAVSYSALLIPQVIDKMKAEKVAVAQPKDAAPPQAKDAVQPKPAADVKPADAAEAEEALVDDKPMTPLDFAMGLVVLCGFMFALPVIAGFSQPISLAIVAFALWEAFKLNRKVDVVITGPHAVGSALPPAAAHA